MNVPGFLESASREPKEKNMVKYAHVFQRIIAQVLLFEQNFFSQPNAH